MYINGATFQSPAVSVTPVSVEWSDFYQTIIGSSLLSVKKRTSSTENKDWNLNIDLISTSSTSAKKGYKIWILETWFKVYIWNAVIILFLFWGSVVFSSCQLLCAMLTAYVPFIFRCGNLHYLLLSWVASQPEFEELSCWTISVRYKMLEYIFLSGIMQYITDNS